MRRNEREAGRVIQKKPAKAPSVGLSSPQALDQAVWQICDVLRRSNCGSALQYVRN